MQTEPSRDMIRALARANGLEIPEDRLEIVLEAYSSFLRTLEELDDLDLPREAEPAIKYALPPDGMPPVHQRSRGAQER